ncbi:MAG: DUF3828 domain-containing protein [Proteobacteria bacterium]|nr:DUF3828 domain-containing protein [Pseudomonadota bacterium]
MRFRLFAAFVLAMLSALPATAGTVISDPVAFVKTVYADSVGTKPEPDDIYTPRLDALFQLEQKEAGGEVGRIDFDFWINGQDSDIKNVKVGKIDVEGAADRMIVVASFLNFGKPEEIHFYFEKTKAGWKLDDVRSAMGEQWTLSLILKYGWDGKD